MCSPGVRRYPPSPPRLVPALLVTFLLLLALAPAALAQSGGQGAPGGQPPPAPPPPPPELLVERPGGKPLIYEGQTTRQLLGGTWYFRQDDLLTQGDTERWYAQDDLVGWTAISVPHNWNAQDTTLNQSSVGWYRKEFRLPRTSRSTSWKVRFEGSNYRTWVWLNGKQIGTYTGYFPFEVDLEGLRRGRNTLVVKVSSLRSNRDLTHWRPAAYNGFGTGGWWNFGGLLREVYVRRIDRIDIEDVHVLPRLPRVGGPARVEVRVKVRNLTSQGPQGRALVQGRRARTSRSARRRCSPATRASCTNSFAIAPPEALAAGPADALSDDRVRRRERARGAAATSSASASGSSRPAAAARSC